MSAAAPRERRRGMPYLRMVAAIAIGIVVGMVMAFIAANLTMAVGAAKMETSANGWTTIRQCGEPDNNMVQQASCAEVVPAINLPQEAVYWYAIADSAGHALDGRNDYVLRFPSGQLPPSEAFWSVTLTKARPRGVLVANSINRYSLGDRSDLVRNVNGSLDIYIQNTPPAGHESNWLPAPTGDFMLWLRDYQPGPSVLSGAYKVPPVEEAS